ncbi:MAG TPA: serine hydrolase domain-containing protein [Candidatus Elarobacter sp.]|jgi:CubicO group peptidase (beta-lactamase class C family)|nr:serine hydrolase domain-containing protein [Candidatus Elarobacter sp.]
MNLIAAQAYAERHGPHALVVQRDGEIVLETYAAGYDADKPHALYSGTKSFWGIAAVAAQHDGLLHLDEHVAETFSSWRDGAKALVTLRQLLQLTSGIGFGGLGAAVPPYEKALATPLKNPPGETFTYGGIPLQVFGAVLARKLASRDRTPHAYLRERVLDPAGVRVGWWRTLKDGTQPLPTGAGLTARDWLAFGALVLGGGDARGETVVAPAELAACFTGSLANPRYGLCWWLSPLPAVPDVVYASGSGGQALYVVPSERAVVARFGGSSSYKHDAFLKRLLGTV